MRNIYKFLIFVFILMLMVAPLFVSAQDGLVPCGKGDSSEEMCDFNDFMALINNVIGFVLFKLVVPISAIMFAYAGFLLVTSGGAEEKRSSAKRIFTDVALGLIIAVAAWLIINTILMVVGYEGDWIGF